MYIHIYIYIQMCICIHLYIHTHTQFMHIYTYILHVMIKTAPKRIGPSSWQGSAYSCLYVYVYYYEISQTAPKRIGPSSGQESAYSRRIHSNATRSTNTTLRRRCSAIRHSSLTCARRGFIPSVLWGGCHLSSWVCGLARPSHPFAIIMLRVGCTHPSSSSATASATGFPCS